MPTILDMLIKTANEETIEDVQEDIIEDVQEDVQEDYQDADMEEIIDDMSDEEAEEFLTQMTEDEELVKSAFYYGMMSVADQNEEDFVKIATNIYNEEGTDIVLESFEGNIEKIASVRETLTDIYLEKIAEEGIDESLFTDEEAEYLESLSEDELDSVFSNMVTKEATLKAAFSVGMEAMNEANEVDHGELMKQAAEENDVSELDILDNTFNEYVEKIAKLTIKSVEMELDELYND